jgi:hypothetical protein
LEGGTVKNRTLVSLFILSFVIAACVPAAPAATSTPIPTQTVPVQPLADTPTTIPLEGSVTDTPTATLLPIILPDQPTLFIPTLPAATINATNTGVQVTARESAVNCRGGPATFWQVGAHLNPGQSTEAVGKNGDASWIYVRNPTSPANFCWVSAEWVNVTGNGAALPFVAEVGTPWANGEPVGRITGIDMELDPDVLEPAACVGSSQNIRIIGKISVDGALEFKYHFEGDDIPNTPTRRKTFTRADIQDFSETFTAPLNAGTHRVFMVVENHDLSGLRRSATYEIICP